MGLCRQVVYRLAHFQKGQEMLRIQCGDGAITIAMPHQIELWTADEVSECLDGLGDRLCSKLWGFLESSENPTPSGGDGSDGTVETPDGRLDSENDDKATNWWDKLEVEEQETIVRAVGRYFG